MNKIKFLYSTILLCFIFQQNSYSQCNTNISICTPGQAGPFNFVSGSANPSTCLDYNNGIGAPNYAYIILYITQGGELDLLIEGDQQTTGGFFGVGACLDVAVFDITGQADPCASLDPATELGCNYVNPCEGCAEFGNTINGCAAQVAAPNVNTGDVIMILVEDYSDAQNEFTLELGNGPNSAQTGPPDATISAVGPFCDTDGAIQLNAVDNGGTWSGPGVSPSGAFDPAAAGVGTHTIDYTIGSAPCDAQDQTTIEVNNCNSCLIDYFEVNANLGNCDDTWEISGTVEFSLPPASGDLIFEDCDGNQTVIASAPFANPGLINYNHTGPLGDLAGGNCDFTVYFSADPLCTQMVTINLPPIIPPDEAGTVTPNLTGNATTNYILCDGDVLDVTSDDNWTIPPIAPGNDPGLVYYVYTCPPTPGGVGIDPGTDPCLAGFISAEDISLLNDGGDADPLLNSIGIGAGDEFYIVPMTLGTVSGGFFQADCYDLAIDQMVTVTYLNPITTTQTQDCQAGTATVTINGGMPEFNGSQFTASNLTPGAATFDNTTAGDGGTITISGLVDGDNWSFDIVDNNGCPITVSGTFTGIQDPSFTYPNSTYCETQIDPSANITGTIGGTFTVNPAGLTVDPNSGLVDLSSASGTYTITYTTPDPVCFDTEDFIITINSEPIIDPLADQEECGTYTLPAITGTNLTGNEAYYDAPNGGGTQYNPGDAITALGTTTLYIYDETGTVPNCFNEQTFDVTINFSPVIDPIADQIECDSYTLPAITGTNLTGNEAYYTSSGSAGTQYNAGDAITAAGTTTLYIYDETGTTPNCFNEQSFDVTINLTPVIDPLADQTACDSYTLPAITGTNLTGNEAYYDAPTGGGTQYNAGDNITASTTLYIYDETATTPNCSDEQTFDVTINITPVVDPLADQTECDSYTLPAITGTDLTGNEAYYDAPNGGGTQYNAGDNITAAGTTTLYIYDETGGVPNCFNEQTFDVTINITPTFTLASTDPTACGNADGTITLSGLEPNTAYDITYSDAGTAVGPTSMNSDAAGDLVIGGLTAGSYSDFVVTLNGCTATDNSVINLVDPNAPAVDAGADQEICEGGDVTLTADNPDGATIAWDNGVTDGVAFNPAVGTVTYTVTADLLGCISTDQVDVTVHPNPIVNAGNDVLICDGESVTLTGSGADSYAWDNSVTDGVSFTPAATQTYTVTGTDTEGCVGTDDVIVTVEPIPTVSFEADNFEGCVPVTVTFTNTSSVPGTDCTWNFGDGSTATGCGQVTHTFNNVGCFDVTLEVTSANGCTSNTTIADYICVSGYPNAAFDFSPDQLTNIANGAQFSNNSTGATSYEWDFGDGQTSTEVNPDHTYSAVEDTFNVQLIATSPFGCKDTAYAVVPIVEELIFYVPNTFTPDRDEFNEVFKPIFTSGFDPFDYNLLIFNRWGEIIFESNNSEVGWDGTYGAESDDLVKDGTYIWKITFKTKINDERVVEVGHVNLLK